MLLGRQHVPEEAVRGFMKTSKKECMSGKIRNYWLRTAESVVLKCVLLTAFPSLGSEDLVMTMIW